MAPAEGAQGLAELVTSTGNNRQNHDPEPGGKRAWGNSDLCPCRALRWEAKSNGSGEPFPCPKASEMMVTRMSGTARWKAHGLWGYIDLNASSASLNVTLTSPYLFLGGLRMGKQLAQGHTARRSWDVSMDLVVPILASLPPLMPRKPKGLNHSSPPGQLGDMTRRRVKGSQLSSSIGRGSAPPPLNTHTRKHAVGEGKNQV